MTIEVPTPSAELLAQLEKQTIETQQSEVAAIAAIRERFACYAKHNGFIKTGNYDMSTSNYSVTREAYYRPDGKRVRALLAVSAFDRDHTDQNRGTCAGFRLYLTERGEWLELKRAGHWTQWQGEAQWWYTDDESITQIELGHEELCREGHIRVMSDAEVGDEYNLSKVLQGIGESMAELCKKLPERFNRLKANAELAQRVIVGAQKA